MDPKEYRERIKPLEYFNDEKFVKRYRLDKASVSQIARLYAGSGCCFFCIYIYIYIYIYADVYVYVYDINMCMYNDCFTVYYTVKPLSLEFQGTRK